ncbi:hypothetical protein BKG58_19955 [Mycobacteroides abscessus subsp. abscessus]|nr:hypothetical protein BKG58_19955 [Mycobacteroides abscessus subsp. abscessus]
MLARDLGLPIPVVMVAGAIAPLLLPAAVHLVPKTAGLPQKARRVVIFAVLVSATAAFALSFASLTAVAQASGHSGRLGMLLPIAVDVLAAAAAYALVVMPADAPATEQPVQTPVLRVEDVPAPEYPSTLTSLAPVHHLTETTPEQAVHQPADGAPEPVEQAGAPTLTSDDPVVHHPGAPVHQEVVTQPVQAVEPPLLVPVHRADAPVQSEAVQTPERVVHRRTEAAPAQSPVVLPVHREQAAAVVQSGGIELPIEKIAEIFARKDSGESQNEIAAAKVAAKRTVSKVLARREELTAEEPEPAFA